MAYLAVMSSRRIHVLGCDDVIIGYRTYSPPFNGSGHDRCPSLRRAFVCVCGYCSGKKTFASIRNKDGWLKRKQKQNSSSSSSSSSKPHMHKYSKITSTSENVSFFFPDYSFCCGAAFSETCNNITYVARTGLGLWTLFFLLLLLLRHLFPIIFV